MPDAKILEWGYEDPVRADSYAIVPSFDVADDLPRQRVELKRRLVMERIPVNTQEHYVSVRSVTRHGSIILGAVNVFSLLIAGVAGLTIINPILSVVLLPACIGFFAMTLPRVRTP